MLDGRFRTHLGGLALVLGLGGCTAVEVAPGYVAPPYGEGRPHLSIQGEREARWTVDAGVLPGWAKSQVERLPSGLRVGLVGGGGLPGTAATTGAEHGVPVAVPVGRVTWPAGARVSRATDDPMWTGAEVRVEWLVTLSPCGTCGAVVDAVPRLTHPCGATAVRAELAVRRSVDLDEAVVIDAAPGHPSEPVLSLLVGGGPGRPARFVIRVRA
jgi:hypothetical protein